MGIKSNIRKILKEEVNNKLKKIIKKKLTNDLSHAEIIVEETGEIWFIDRENKYWYLEFEKSGKLWWRETFFLNFFDFFSMKRFEFESIISEWVEEVLNRKVISVKGGEVWNWEVKKVLNRKVASTHPEIRGIVQVVDDVLNQDVVSVKVKD